MVRPIVRPAALSIIASSLAALGVVAVGVQIGQGSLGGDPRNASPALTRPAAQVIVPIRSTEPPLVDQFFDIASAPTRQPSTIPVLAPGPQSVPVPGPSNDGGGDGGGAPAPTPVPIPTDPITVPDVESPLPPPDTTVIDPLVTLVEGLLGAGSEEAGAEAPTSPISSLLGL